MLYKHCSVWYFGIYTDNLKHANWCLYAFRYQCKQGLNAQEEHTVTKASSYAMVAFMTGEILPDMQSFVQSFKTRSGMESLHTRLAETHSSSLWFRILTLVLATSSAWRFLHFSPMAVRLLSDTMTQLARHRDVSIGQFWTRQETDLLSTSMQHLRLTTWRRLQWEKKWQKAVCEVCVRCVWVCVCMREVCVCVRCVWVRGVCVGEGGWWVWVCHV